MRYSRLLILLAFALTTFSACKVTMMSSKNKTKTFKTTERGLGYMMVKDVKGTQYPQDGDMVEFHITTVYEDSIMFDSKKQNNGKPVQFKWKEPSFNGDLMEGIKMLTAGDSAVFRVLVDTIIATGQRKQDWMDTGKYVYYSIALKTVKTQEQINMEKGEKAGAQKETDEKLLAEYFAKNKIQPKKTASGLYYVINQEGTGATPTKGQTVAVNYTGRTIDGKAFDSSTDPAFGHVSPLEFPIGQGRVIAGWDEGISLLNKGAKGVLYIPSYLAYGENTPDPNKIPANSILIFDVELVDIK
ncbi:MAG: FKBP-type peptidyl-prolyl cis-trans isomerase [Flavipsychrobacter sp.]